MNGNRRLTIDSSGNVVPRPYGISRWAKPRVRECRHDDCDKAAKVLKVGEPDMKAHNCCGEH